MLLIGPSKILLPQQVAQGSRRRSWLVPQAQGGVVRARTDSRVAGGSKLGAGGVEKRAPWTQPLSVGGRFSGRVPQRPMGVLHCALESWARGAAASFPCALPVRPWSILPESPLLVRWYGPGLKGPGGLGPAQCVGEGPAVAVFTARRVRLSGHTSGAAVGHGDTSTWPGVATPSQPRWKDR